MYACAPTLEAGAPYIGLSGISMNQQRRPAMKSRIDLDFLKDLNFPLRGSGSVDKQSSDFYEDALDEALRCTFPASDPIALDFSSPRTENRQLKARFISAFQRLHPCAPVN
jgi:hypothetical protein